MLKSVVAAMVLVLSAAPAACGGNDDDGDARGSDGGREITSTQVVWAEYGGAIRDARNAAYLAPFTEREDISGIFADADPAQLQLFAERERAEWDLVEVGGWDVIRFAKEGLLAKLPPWVTRMESVPKGYRDYLTGGASGSTLIAYDSEDVKPQSWADFFDTEKFPGKRGLPNFVQGQVEAALLADGVPCEELWPLDFDRAFGKLDEIRDDLLFYDSFGQGMQFLAQGSVEMVTTVNSRATILADQGFPVGIVWKDALLESWFGPVIPKHAPNMDAAFGLVNFMAQPEPQAQFSRLTFFGPGNPEALELLDDATLDRLPNSPQHAEIACEVNQEAQAKQIDEYTERYSEWLARG